MEKNFEGEAFYPCLVLCFGVTIMSTIKRQLLITSLTTLILLLNISLVWANAPRGRLSTLPGDSTFTTYKSPIKYLDSNKYVVSFSDNVVLSFSRSGYMYYYTLDTSVFNVHFINPGNRDTLITLSGRARHAKDISQDFFAKTTQKLISKPLPDFQLPDVSDPDIRPYKYKMFGNHALQGRVSIIH